MMINLLWYPIILKIKRFRLCNILKNANVVGDRKSLHFNLANGMLEFYQVRILFEQKCLEQIWVSKNFKTCFCVQ